jgi:Rrf2 family protein
MRISAKTEYACIAMLDLAAEYGSEEPVSIRLIGERHGVPPRFLVQILLQLKEAGYVKSIRGAAGGYQLSKNPKDITIGTIMEVVDSSVRSSGKPTSNATKESSAVKVLFGTWGKIYDEQQKALHGVTLADLLQKMKRK